MKENEGVYHVVDVGKCEFKTTPKNLTKAEVIKAWYTRQMRSIAVALCHPGPCIKRCNRYWIRCLSRQCYSE